MNKLWLLLKTYGKIYLGAIAKRRNKKEYLSGGIIIILIGLLFVSLFTSTAVTTISQFLALDPPAPIYALYALTITGMIFMFLMVVLRGTNFKKSNDHELLLALPLSKFVIVLSKILKDFLFDFISLLLIMMPGYISYYVMVPDASILVVFFGFIVIMLLTFISNALSILLNTIISKLTRKFKYAEIVQTLLSVVITICFIVVYYIVNVSMTSSPDFIEHFLSFYPLQLIINFIGYSDFFSLLILSVMCIVPFMVSILIMVHDFNRPAKGYNASNKNLIYKKRKVTINLFKNESSRYFRSTTYVINTIIGALFILLFAFLIVGFGVDRITSMITTFVPNSETFIERIDVIIVLMATLVASTVITTSASISIEGKYFWIMKAHPISEKAIFNSKILLNLIIGGIPVIISALVLTTILGIEFLPFLIILPLLSLLFAAISGLSNNLKYYKLDWKDEQEVIKQGIAVLISMGTALLPTLGLMIIYFLLLNTSLNPFVFLSLAVIFMLGVDTLMYYYLLTKGVNRFQNIID